MDYSLLLGIHEKTPTSPALEEPLITLDDIDPIIDEDVIIDQNGLYENAADSFTSQQDQIHLVSLIPPPSSPSLPEEGDDSSGR